jgi:hypothetical protein
MGDNTIGNLRGKGSSATYWRRRFFALVIGLSVFGVLAWAVSGALGQPKPIQAAGNVTSSGHQHSGTGAGNSGSAGGNGTGASGGTATTASPSPSPSSASPAASPSATPTGSGGGQGKPG